MLEKNKRRVPSSLWSGRRGSNPRPSAWKANALSTELLPQKRTARSFPFPIDSEIQATRSALFLSGKWWIRTTEGVSQQIYSLPHLATLVTSLMFLNRFRSTPPCRLRKVFWSRWRDSNPRPADYKSAALANWATSAYRPIWIAKVGKIKLTTKNLIILFYHSSQRTFSAIEIEREIGCKYSTLSGIKK